MLLRLGHFRPYLSLVTASRQSAPDDAVTHQSSHAPTKPTQHALHDVQLVDVAVPREERLAVRQLRHDAADGPHVHLAPVVGAAQQQLGRPGQVGAQLASADGHSLLHRSPLAQEQQTENPPQPPPRAHLYQRVET